MTEITLPTTARSKHEDVVTERRWIDRSTLAVQSRVETPLILDRLLEAGILSRSLHSAGMTLRQLYHAIGVKPLIMDYEDYVYGMQEMTDRQANFQGLYNELVRHCSPHALPVVRVCIDDSPTKIAPLVDGLNRLDGRLGRLMRDRDYRINEFLGFIQE